MAMRRLLLLRIPARRFSAAPETAAGPVPTTSVVENTGSTARDHLANERTFLAWAGTALSFVGLGVGVDSLLRVSAVNADPRHAPERWKQHIPATSLCATGAVLLSYATGTPARCRSPWKEPIEITRDGSRGGGPTSPPHRQHTPPPIAPPTPQPAQHPAFLALSAARRPRARPSDEASPRAGGRAPSRRVACDDSCCSRSSHQRPPTFSRGRPLPPLAAPRSSARATHLHHTRMPTPRPTAAS